MRLTRVLAALFSDARLKDPRYGRNSELAGEDPTLAGEYAVAYLKGMQQWAGAGAGARIKMNAYVKHYTACKSEVSLTSFAPWRVQVLRLTCVLVALFSDARLQIVLRPIDSISSAT